MASLYPISFLITLGALTSWFYFREDEKRSALLSKVFFVALIVFGVSWVSVSGNWSYKFTMIGRELLILVSVPIFLSLFRKNKWVYLVLLFMTLGLMDYFYFDRLKSTFSIKVVESKVDYGDYDKNGEILIEIRNGHDIHEIQTVLERFELTFTPAFKPKDFSSTDLDDYYLVNIPTSFESNLTEIVKALKSSKAVEWVEINEQYVLSPIESEELRTLPDINEKYGLNDPGVENLWAFDAMNIDNLFSSLNGVKPKRKAIIAILDTGVDALHEDISANFVSTQTKYDNDPRGHGTHCAGIAGAVSNNNKGVASFSQQNEFVQITSIKVLSAGGFGTQKMIIDGIVEAADSGVDVISLSLGGLSNDKRQKAYKEAIDYANLKGAIVVVAAGNSNKDARDFTPANVEGVIAVSAIDSILKRAIFSNKVDHLKMGIAAPGVDIYSTFPNSQYKVYSGTSMAAPYVSGLVGLMKSLDPELTTEEVFNILNDSGMTTSSKSETGNLIQPGAAIERLKKEKQIFN